MRQTGGLVTYRRCVRALDAVAQLRGQDGLQQRAAQADPDDLPGGPEEIGDCAGRTVTSAPQKHDEAS